jgi:AraC-like DNA-binding protein/DNA-binding transcriptional ArsR family regulator
MNEYTLPHQHGHKHHIKETKEQLNKTEDFQTVADIFKQLSDTSRLKIFWLLCHMEECVIDIAALMDMTTPAVSHHLKQLRAGGLIVGRRDGKEVYYKAADTRQSRLLHQMIEQMMAVVCPDGGLITLHGAVAGRNSGALHGITAECDGDSCLHGTDSDHPSCMCDLDQDECSCVYGARSSCKIAELLLELSQDTQTSEDTSPQYQAEQILTIRKVHDYMMEHLDSHITIETLARQFLMNPTTLKHVFKAVYGMPLATHMKEHRIRKAAALLKETDDSIGTIARAVGYENPSKFSAAFREFYHMTPNEYRK